MQRFCAITSLTLLFTGLVSSSLVTRAKAAEPIRVQLTSGRTLDGEVSPRTNSQRFWLVQRAGAAVLSRPIAWGNIIAAEFRQQSLTSRQLHDILVPPMSPVVAAIAVVQPDPQDSPQTPFAVDPLATEELPPPTSDANKEAVDSGVVFLAVPALPVASVRFDAHIANWDADVEADGLVVQVVPVDRYGQVVPVRGALQVELFGVRRISFQDAPSKRGRSYGRLGSWTQQLAAEYFHSDGGWFKLPFQAAQPEFDSRIGVSGLVHVKLVVPGVGVFEDSLDGIRLRPFAPLRDAMERDNGQRFFPTETTGLGKRPW